jgi:ribosomal protein S27AE
VKQSCVRCGDPRTQAHHKDYSNPFDVIWLCPFCHSREHRPSK